MTKRTIAAVTVGLALAMPVWADSNRPADIQTLGNAQENLAQAQHGGGTQTLAEQRQRQDVQRLLNKLEAGQQVNPAEVERVLRESLNQQ